MLEDTRPVSKLEGTYPLRPNKLWEQGNHHFPPQDWYPLSSQTSSSPMASLSLAKEQPFLSVGLIPTPFCRKLLVPSVSRLPAPAPPPLPWPWVYLVTLSCMRSAVLLLSHCLQLCAKYLASICLSSSTRQRALAEGDEVSYSLHPSFSRHPRHMTRTPKDTFAKCVEKRLRF